MQFVYVLFWVFWHLHICYENQLSRWLLFLFKGQWSTPVVTNISFFCKNKILTLGHFWFVFSLDQRDVRSSITFSKAGIIPRFQPVFSIPHDLAFDVADVANKKPLSIYQLNMPANLFSWWPDHDRYWRQHSNSNYLFVFHQYLFTWFFAGILHLQSEQLSVCILHFIVFFILRYQTLKLWVKPSTVFKVRQPPAARLSGY
jgi:hypothetical protein